MAQKMTEKQKAFCDYYIETLNATEAAMKAGYSKRTAKDIGCENLAKPNLRQYIQERLDQLESNRVAGQKEIMEFLTSVVRGEISEEVPVVMQTQFKMVDKKPSLRERIKAAEQIGKRYAMWTDKQEVEANHHVTFVEDLGDDIDD